MGLRRLVQIALISCAVCFLTAFAGAMSETPRPIDQPVPEKWRAPLARFLEEFVAKDANSMLAESKAQPFPGQNPDRIIFRITHAYFCTEDLDLCPTVIGRVQNGALEVDAMFLGGGNVSVSDIDARALGDRAFFVRSLPVIFNGKASAVSVVETSKGLMIVPQVAESR